ncbi:helix-turn-helix domain-containing protein [Maribacter sp. LLG6340-A2]|uniref:helix-turn-helix domain-containing protein n=1 Tax=Maribacter sp. LLG6340-A2 TaxID=3160834 RepID=UPI0038687F23
MLDSSAFIKRVKTILTHYNMSAAAFADTIRVQRSSISHLLSGRNKPSLEFVMKIHETFSGIELSWLLYGKGSFPPTSQKTEDKSVAIQTSSTKMDAKNQRIIDRIIIFYKDGTFKTYSEQ